jgi:hypothetical protein
MQKPVGDFFSDETGILDPFHGGNICHRKRPNQL